MQKLCAGSDLGLFQEVKKSEEPKGRKKRPNDVRGPIDRKCPDFVIIQREMETI